ncbi:MAG: recombination mediator RecR [Phycisphaerales bacterium]
MLSEFARLPGIGRRSAERLAFFVLMQKPEEALALAQAIHDVKTKVSYCPISFNFADADSEGGVCPINLDPRRDRSLVLVVEQPRDLIAIEGTGMFRGIYHVLLGRISPLDGVGPEDLTIPQLLERVDNPAKNAGGQRITEVVLALNPTLEGDGTSLYLSEQLQKRGVKVTRLARGLPSGSQLEFASKAVLADAIAGRQSMHSGD